MEFIEEVISHPSREIPLSVVNCFAGVFEENSQTAVVAAETAILNPRERTAINNVFLIASMIIDVLVAEIRKPIPPYQCNGDVLEFRIRQRFEKDLENKNFHTMLIMSCLYFSDSGIWFHGWKNGRDV